MQTVVTVTLVIKGDPQEAADAAYTRLAAWFNEDPSKRPPFPERSLLWYSIQPDPKRKIDIYQERG